MAQTYSPLQVNVTDYQDIFITLYQKNNTLGKSLVNLVPNVKNNSLFTNFTITSNLQAYSVSAPTQSGTIAGVDTLITPVKYMDYFEFNYESLRPSRFNQDMKAGAWETVTEEYNKKVLSQYAPVVSAALENLFWNGALAATKVTIASMTQSATTSERAFVAGSDCTTSLFDGILAKLILDNTRHNVVATASITESNIKAEYNRAYAGIDPILLAQAETPVIYAPLIHKQYIALSNSNDTYRDTFTINGDSYSFNGLEIRFVPFNIGTVLFITLPSLVNWLTDLESDYNYIAIDKVQNNADIWYIKFVTTIETFVQDKAMSTLYI
jgi:hypothetical protein